MQTETETGNEELDRLALAKLVRALMRRHGIGHRQQSTLLAQILMLSYSQAHRKLNGEVDWTLKQLRSVATYFHESLESIGLYPSQLHVGLAGLRQVEATLQLAGTEKRYQCRAWLGARQLSTFGAQFFAYEESGQWRVVEGGSVLPNLLSYEVVRLEIVFPPPPLVTVALQIADAELQKTLGDSLRGAGIDAIFLGHGEEEAVERVIDAYIIDWPMRNRRDEYSIPELRALAGSRVPIYLLSDQVTAASDEEGELTQLVVAFGIFWRERPLRVEALIAELMSVTLANSEARND